jgi:hypothetical protein
MATASHDQATVSNANAMASGTNADDATVEVPPSPNHSRPDVRIT